MSDPNPKAYLRSGFQPVTDQRPPTRAPAKPPRPIQIAERLDGDKPDGGGHELHIRGGGELVMALVSELIDLRDAERRRLASQQRCPYLRLVRRLQRRQEPHVRTTTTRSKP